MPYPKGPTSAWNHKCPYCAAEWKRQCPVCNGQRGQLEAPRASACPSCTEEREMQQRNHVQSLIARAFTLLQKGPQWDNQTHDFGPYRMLPGEELTLVLVQFLTAMGEPPRVVESPESHCIEVWMTERHKAARRALFSTEHPVDREMVHPGTMFAF